MLKEGTAISDMKSNESMLVLGCASCNSGSGSVMIFDFDLNQVYETGQELKRDRNIGR